MFGMRPRGIPRWRLLIYELAATLGRAFQRLSRPLWQAASTGSVQQAIQASNQPDTIEEPPVLDAEILTINVLPAWNAVTAATSR